MIGLSDCLGSILLLVVYPAIILSLKTAAIATVIVFFLGIATARWMWSYKGRGKAIIESVLTAPLVLPPTVVGFLLLLLLGRNGIIGRWLNSLGISVVFTWYAVVIAAVVVAFPLMYKTALSAFNQVDNNLIACSRTLGASEWEIFWRILLPLARSGVIAGTLLSFARALGEFGATIMLAGAIPSKTETMPIAIYLAAESGQMDRALVLVLVMLGISFALLLGVEHWEATDKPVSKGLLRKFGYPVTKLFNKRVAIANNLDNKIQLAVDVEKQLNDFCLRVSFDSNITPLGILGASGAGKTTIMRCIAGLETPDRGRIVLNNRILYDSKLNINLPARKRRCGLLFQDYALFPHLTVGENVAFGMVHLSPKKQQQAIKRELALVELSHYSDRFPHQLSGGQKQRVALARLRASNPEIMLLDEPFSALDTYLRHKQEKILRLSLQSYRGMTVLITHNLEEAYRICPQLLIIDGGKAIAYDTKENIFHHADNIRTAQVTNCKNFSQAIAISSTKIEATDWHCNLEVSRMPKQPIMIGIRAHQIILESEIESDEANIFNCWLASYSETQHRVTCYLKLHHPAQHEADYHLQTEVLQDKWQQLKTKTLPWQVQLKPWRIMVFES